MEPTKPTAETRKESACSGADARHSRASKKSPALAGIWTVGCSHEPPLGQLQPSGGALE